MLATIIIILAGTSTFLICRILAARILPKADSKLSSHIELICQLFDRQLIAIKKERIEVAVFVSMGVFFAICLVMVPGVLLKILFLPLFLVVGWNAPLWAAKFMLKRRIAKFESQFVDGLTLVANAIKSGLSLQQAFEMVSLEMPSPFGEDFAHLLAEVRLGKSMEDSLHSMSGRIGTDDLALVVQSICILRETGGNIIETFQTITATIRERQKVHGKVKVLTTQGVAQGVIIFCMPFALAGALYFFAPEFIMPLFQKPLGWVFVAAALMLQTTGALLMKKIVMIRV